jgi:hypothetical protein
LISIKSKEFDVSEKMNSNQYTRRVAAPTIAHQQLLHMTLGGKKYETSSKLNRTPPIGAPNATATPAAQAALSISLLFPSLRSNFGNSLVKMLPMQHAICTNGPSLPSVNPDPTDSDRPTAFVNMVDNPRYPRMTNLREVKGNWSAFSELGDQSSIT